ncbi:MAG TPA: hypothetical protein VFL97_08360, partial [Nitrococcus sp.]|nr:hypothetical protein [Nitrococcus sp.]
YSYLAYRGLLALPIGTAQFESANCGGVTADRGLAVLPILIQGSANSGFLRLVWFFTGELAAPAALDAADV